LQSILVFAVSECYAQNIAVEDMEQFEKELYSFFEKEKTTVSFKVKNAQKFDDELRQELKNALDEFVERF
jgi:F0F1-type ATP synthase alpha subunit